MSKIVNNFLKLFNTKKSKLFWCYMVVGIIVSIFAIMLMPFWKDNNIDVFFKDWGYKIINIIIALCLAGYLFLYLFKKLFAKGRSVVKILSIIEFVLLSLIALGCVFSQFNVIKITDSGKILGLALWIRGVIEVFRAYYYNTSNEQKYTLFELVFAILLITFGVYFATSNILTNKIVLWITTVTLLVVGVITTMLGFIKK